MVSIIWFQQDLRLIDNPALAQAAKSEHVMPIYIFDESSTHSKPMGSASRCWLHHSLISLNESIGGKLNIYSGRAHEVFQEISCRFKLDSVCWNQCYEPFKAQQETQVKKVLSSKNIAIHRFNGALLWQPWEINKDDHTPYKVFTPFYKKSCLNAIEPRKPIDRPQHANYIEDSKRSVMNVAQLNLLPKVNWHQALVSHWHIGERGAQDRFQQFINQGLSNYKNGRNFPAAPYVSRLSPHLHFGEISVNQLWHTVRRNETNQDTEHFCSELGWREFSYNQLYHNPNLAEKNLQPKFDLFPWRHNQAHLKAWQKGQTGIPIVDAGMRELWQTGYMHNRVRMIVGSFLVKNLRLHWHHGEKWFWDTLFDADLASNSASWQWIAGCGADAAPYFRVFNPVTQGLKFDPNGDYIRRFVPEISSLPNPYLLRPWEAPTNVLKQASIKLGETYPVPIVDLKQSRNDALMAFNSLKAKAH